MRGASSLIVAMVLLAGCAADPAVDTASVDVGSQAPAVGFLPNATKPLEALAEPVFDLLGAIAKTGPVYGGGEPAIAVAPDGTIYVAFPGCDRDPLWLVDVLDVVPGQECRQGVVYRSDDEGATWTRLNEEDTGKLGPGAEDANGDADVTIDAAGVVYVSNLGNGVQTHRSFDKGETWESTGDVVPENDTGIDRQWLTAAGAGHVIHNWMGSTENVSRAVGIRATFDGGTTWADPVYLGESIGWEGSVQFAPNGTAYIPYTMPIGEFGPVGASSYELYVGRSGDGGRTWTEHPTGIEVSRAATSFHFSGMMLAPALTITGDGHVVYVYAEEQPDPALAAANLGGVVRLIWSSDGGVTWNGPLDVSTAPAAIMPWAVGGAGDRVGLTYFANTLPGEPDRSGRWDLRAAIVDLESGELVDTLVEADIHLGGICSGGGSCLLTGGDRALLDYFENAVLPDGRMVVAYPADPVQGGKYIEIRVAIQSDGSRLFDAGIPMGEAS